MSHLRCVLLQTQKMLFCISWNCFVTFKESTQLIEQAFKNVIHRDYRDINVIKRLINIVNALVKLAFVSFHFIRFLYK